MQPNYLDGQGRDNSRMMPHSQHQGPDMDNCNWPIHEPDQHQVTNEVKYHIQLNVDNRSVYLEHPIDIIRLKPEELVEGGDQQLKVEVDVRSGDIKQESDTSLRIESIYSLSSDRPRLNFDSSVIEQIKFETGEIKEEHTSFETDHSDTLMQIKGFSSDVVSEHNESENVSSVVGRPFFEEQGGSSFHRSIDATPGNTVMKDSEEDCNEVDLLIKNARKNVIYAESDCESTRCQLSGEEFSSTREINLHYRKHMGGKHACKFCDYKTTKKSSFITHLRTHTGEKPFSCDLCDYKAAQKSSLVSHLRSHTGKRPFSCELCDFKAAWKSSLITHLRTHTGTRPFSCDLCDYKAAKKSSLIIHVRTHTGEKIFSCDLCDYKATQKSNLNTHLRTHTGKRPFSCDLCDYKARQKSCLITHLRTHTGEKTLRTHTGEKTLRTHTGEKTLQL
ncbi:histone-lysine N-methyltransferase PRDM9-like isoform X2 [Nilaparvata lugens]|uniref:histone-lysine N-methyltransferase PRDM9-like isoform X2 n=1 Tax=Nilaparvata lugens TaxID=108931 RepID=UPI00193D69F8|nr:histone-lysine N-methyltransferase PRDM9-like isoform X2 [Nilaparvata lugens]